MALNQLIERRYSTFCHLFRIVVLQINALFLNNISRYHFYSTFNNNTEQLRRTIYLKLLPIQKPLNSVQDLEYLRKYIRI